MEMFLCPLTIWFILFTMGIPSCFHSRSSSVIHMLNMLTLALNWTWLLRAGKLPEEPTKMLNVCLNHNSVLKSSVRNHKSQIFLTRTIWATPQGSCGLWWIFKREDTVVIEAKLCYHFSGVQHFPKFSNVMGVSHGIFWSLSYLFILSVCTHIIFHVINCSIVCYHWRVIMYYHWRTCKNLYVSHTVQEKKVFLGGF